MKFGKAVGTVVLCLLLCFSTALLLGTSLLRLVVLNPAFYKAFAVTPAYCAELRTRIGENLDHVAILYGLDEGALNDVVTDEDIAAYTDALIDALFDDATTDTLALPPYPTEGFAAYLDAHTAYSEQAIRDFSEDCAASVYEDLSAVNVGLFVSGVTRVRTSRLALLSPVLAAAALLLTGVLIALVKTVHSETPRIGRVAVWGGLFMGVSTLFVPLSEFWLFDYIDRLNLSISAFRTILSNLLKTALYGSLAALGALLAVTLLLLIVACAIAARPVKRKRSAR